jgi:hypothetical protein
MDYSPPLSALLESSASRSPHETLIHEETEALAQLTPPESPTGSLISTVQIDLPNPLPLPLDDDIKAPHPQFTLSFGDIRSIRMMEVIGPSPNTNVDSVMRPFAVRAELNPNFWKNTSLEIIVCLHDAKTAENVTNNVLAGDTTITGVQSEGLDKHGESILVFDFPIIGLQILREGRFYFTYAFIDPEDETRAFWDLTGSVCKATRRRELCKQTTTFSESQLTLTIISGP